MKKLIVYILLVLPIVFFRCKNSDSSTNEKNVEEEKIARVNSKYLSKKTFDSLFKESQEKEDSLLKRKKIINDWILQQLLLEKSAEIKEFPFDEINHKVEQYRKELMLYEMKRKYFESFRPEISADEIQQYYEKDNDNLLLDHIIVKCKFVLIKNKRSENKKIKEYLDSETPETLEKLKKYCYTNAIHYHLEGDKWVNFETVTQNTPLKFIKNKTSFVRTSKKYSKKHNKNRLFFYILDYKLKGEKAPLAFVKDKIVRLLTREKSRGTIENFSEKLIEKAIKKKKIEIY